MNLQPFCQQYIFYVLNKPCWFISQNDILAILILERFPPIYLLFVSSLNDSFNICINKTVTRLMVLGKY